MGRTVPSFRIVLAEKKREWTPFRNALDKKSERKAFDEMWNVPRLYVSACSNSVQLVPLHPIVISILFHHYKELKECIAEVEQIIEEEEEASSSTATDNNNSSNKKIDWLTIKKDEKAIEEQEQKEEMLTTLDGYILLQDYDAGTNR